MVKFDAIPEFLMGKKSLINYTFYKTLKLETNIKRLVKIFLSHTYCFSIIFLLNDV